MASLTKPLMVSEYFVKQRGFLNKKISDTLLWLPKTDLKVKDFLNHQSGLKAHVEFYKKLQSTEKNDLKKMLRSEFEKNSFQEEVSKPRYSDLGFMVLGFFIEEVEKKKLESLVKTLPYKNDFHLASHKSNKKLYAPTEKCLWRNKKIQGEVFDDNAYAVEGLLGHAGLFGSLDSMLNYGKHLEKLYDKNKSHFKKQNSEWANGFMVPSGGNKTSAGAFFSKKSIGHLGFTGTSFWYDPEVKLFVAMLSNRSYPNRNDKTFNLYRPLIQNIIYKHKILDF